ncbi:MAG: LacI family transcriptional regulator [Burkholderiales bacterium]|nr:MAG: LacI family transcriptional regulator [Burkholderiales bacterium]
MSIQALADSLGISISTVSRALNGYSDVSASTRQKVFDAAKAMNYSPHPVAHRLATGKTGAVAILNPARSGQAIDGSSAILHTGVTQVMREHKYFVLSLTLPTGEDEATELERLLAGRLVDGVVVTRTRTQDSRVSLLQQRNIPFVTHGRTIENAPHAWVDVDHEGVVAQATSALIERGHRRIAFINGMVHMSFAHLRDQGFRSAISQAGLALEHCPIHYTELTGQMGRHVAAQLLAGNAMQRPTAFVCASDLMAIGVMSAIRDAGLQVGQDVSVFGQGNTEAGLLSAPPLASTEHDLLLHGQHIARLLLQQIAGEDGSIMHWLESSRLLLRGSVASAPDTA